MTYDAFISYSHKRDMEFGAAIQEGLQRLGKPWYKLRQLTIFRDDTDLSASPGLWNRIEHALDQSEYFILLASPESSQSEWVQKELMFWLKNKDVNKLLIALTFGSIEWTGNDDFDWEKTNALPIALSQQFQELPLYIDFTELRNSTDLSLGNPRFKTNIAKISSAIQDIPAKELIEKDVQEHRKTIRLRNTAITVLILFLAGLSIALVIIVQQRNEARRIALANQHVVYALNKISVTQSLHHAYRAYELNPSAYTANLLTGFAEDPITFYDVLKLTDTVTLTRSVWSNGNIYTGYEHGILKCMNHQKKVLAEIRIPLQEVKEILPLKSNTLAVIGHPESSTESLLYLVEEITLKIKAAIRLPSYITTAFVDSKNVLVTGDTDGCIRNFSENGKLIDSIHLSEQESIEGLAKDKAGNYLVLLSRAGSCDSFITRNNKKGIETGRFKSPAAIPLKRMAFSSVTGDLLAVDEQGNSYIWDSTGVVSQRASLVEDGLLSPGGILSLENCYFTPSGQAFAILANGSCIVRERNGKVKAVAGTLFTKISSVSFFDDERFLTSGAGEPYLFFWDIRGYKIQSADPGLRKQDVLWSQQSADYCTKRGDTLVVRQLFHPERPVVVFHTLDRIKYFISDTGRTILVANEGTACLISKYSGEIVKKFPLSGNRILFADFYNEKLYLDSDKGWIEVIDWRHLIRDTIKLPRNDQVMFLKVHRDGTVLVGGGTVSKSAFLLVYDRSYRLKRTFTGLREVVNDGLFSADGTKVTIVDDGGTLKQWAIEKTNPLLDVQVSTGVCMEVTASSDEKHYLVNDMLANAVHLLDADGFHLQVVAFEQEPSHLNFINNDEFCVFDGDRIDRLFTVEGFIKSNRMAKPEVIQKLEQGIQPFVISGQIRRRLISNQYIQ